MARNLPSTEVKSYLRIRFPVAAQTDTGTVVQYIDIPFSEGGSFKIPKVTVEDGVGNLTLKQYEAIEAAAQEVVNNEFIRTQITAELVTISAPDRW
jgi:hypothetical protein